MKRIVLLLTILFNVVYADIDIALPETVIGQDISAIKKVFNCGTGSTSNVNEYTISKKVGHAWREYIFNYFGYAGSSKFRKGLNNKVIRYKIIFERGGFPNLYSDEHASTDGVYRKDVLIKKSKKTVKFTIHDLNMKDIPYEAYSYTASCGFVKQYYPILKKPRKAVNMLE